MAPLRLVLPQFPLRENLPRAGRGLDAPIPGLGAANERMDSYCLVNKAQCYAYAAPLGEPTQGEKARYFYTQGMSDLYLLSVKTLFPRRQDRAQQTFFRDQVH